MSAMYDVRPVVRVFRVPVHVKLRSVRVNGFRTLRSVPFITPLGFPPTPLYTTVDRASTPNSGFFRFQLSRLSV
jgi:hypothetical protein